MIKNQSVSKKCTSVHENAARVVLRSVSFFALLFNSANAVRCWFAQWPFRGMFSGFANSTLAIPLAIGLLGGLFASPAEAVVKTYYAQENGTCTSSYGTAGNVWKPAAEGNSGSCTTRSTLGGRWNSGTARDMLIAYTPPYASQTIVTGQTGSNIRFTETGRGAFTGRVRFVEINAAGNSILGNLTGEVTINVPDTGSANITNLSTLSGTINAGNRLGMVVAITNPDTEAFTYFGDNDGVSSNAAWFVVNEVAANSPASLVVNQPDGTGDTIAEGGNFTVNYNLSDSDNVTTVSFFYETDGNGAGGTAISGCGTQPEATGGTCVWNTSGVAPGSYYVYGTTSGDGAGAATVVSSGTMTINDAPALSISEPNGTGDTVAAGSVYNITYTLTDSDNTITAPFYYDSDAVGFNGTAISGACASAAEGSGVTCAWNTTGMTPGSYYVYGTTTDGVNSAAQAYSPGVITITAANIPATLVVNQPDGTGDTIAEGGSFTVNYNLSDSDNVTTVSFFYDTNNSGADGTAISGCATQPEATGGTCVWNTSGVAPGSYFVYGTTSGDGAGAATVYSLGTMTINDAPALSISAPNGTTVTVGSVYNITYTLTDSDNTITAAFYYDSDAVGFNGTAISGACASAAEGSGVTCAWNTTGMTPGSYYVYGISTTDANNSAAQAYSPGVITISSNSVASLVVNQPDGTGDTIAEGGSFTVNYNLSDSDDATTVAFFYDTNNSGADGTAIGGCGAKPEASGGTCVWNTSGVAPGSYYVYGTTSGDGAGATTVYSLGTMTIVAALSYVSGDDGTNPGAGDSIAGISRVGGGDDSNNLVSSKPKINVEYEFSINFIDNSGETPQVSPRLYIAHRDSPTEGAGGDFFVYPLVCTGATWAGGKTCTTTMKLGPAASHKFYFYAQKTNGTPVRLPSSGYSDGPWIQLINGYSLAGASRDIDSSSLDGSAAFNSPYSYDWVSAGLDTTPFVTFNGNYVAVTTPNPAKAGKGYFVYKSSNTLPQLGLNADVTAVSHTITLQAGWNLISNPYNGNVKLSVVQIRRNGATTNFWSNAAGLNWIEPAIYYYQGSDWGKTYASEFGSGAELVPWMGYWMYVKDVNSYQLIITKPAQ